MSIDTDRHLRMFRDTRYQLLLISDQRGLGAGEQADLERVEREIKDMEAARDQALKQ